MYTSVVVNDGCVAQLVEHLTFNQRVSGSNPDALTIRKSFCFYRSFFVFKKLYGFISALLHQQLANELFFIGFLTISIKNHISVKLTLATYQNIG